MIACSIVMYANMPDQTATSQRLDPQNTLFRWQRSCSWFSGAGIAAAATVVRLGWDAATIVSSYCQAGDYWVASILTRKCHQHASNTMCDFLLLLLLLLPPLPLRLPLPLPTAATLTATSFAAKMITTDYFFCSYYSWLMLLFLASIHIVQKVNPQ